jgi:hypothetical protein
MSTWELQSVLDKALDTASALLLALTSILSPLIASGELGFIHDEVFRNALLGLRLSKPGYYCDECGGLPDYKQFNMFVTTDDYHKDVIWNQANELLFKAYTENPEYDTYYLCFKNPRLTGNFIRITKNHFKDVVAGRLDVSGLVGAGKDDGDWLWFDPPAKEIDISEAIYHRFPRYECPEYAIHDVEDFSLDDRKRIKACVFIGSNCDKREIMRIINASVDWVKKIPNPPSMTLPIKHGSMDADCVYLRFYKHDTRQSRELYENNDNFICSVVYAASPQFSLSDEQYKFVPYLVRNKEVILNKTIYWRERQYLPTINTSKVSRNALCPCGSGKKYKLCCGKGQQA